MRPRIAVSIPARTVSEASKMVRRVKRLGADLAEIRLDYLEGDVPVEKLARAQAIPLIATFRSSKNRAARNSEEGQRTEALITAAEAGFSYVDVELETRDLSSVIDKLLAAGAKAIASHHDFTETPSDIQLRKVLRLCRNSGAALSKLITTAKKLEDNLRLLTLAQEESKKCGLICFAMGRLGVLSRIFSPFYGASFTFASLGDEGTVAPGQISISRMRRIYTEMGYS